MNAFCCLRLSCILSYVLSRKINVCLSSLAVHVRDVRRYLHVGHGHGLLKSILQICVGRGQVPLLRQEGVVTTPEHIIIGLEPNNVPLKHLTLTIALFQLSLRLAEFRL